MPRFDCVISGQAQLRAFSKSLQYLSKVGHELFVDLSPEKLVIRTLSQSQAAFASVSFLNSNANESHHSFFSSFNFVSKERDERTGRLLTKFTFQVSLRTTLVALKSSAASHISKLKLSIDDMKNVWIWEISMNSGIRKIVTIAFDDEDAAASNANVIPQVDLSAYELFSFRPKLMLPCLVGFHQGIDEMTIAIEKESLIVSSFIDEYSLMHNKFLTTKYKLPSRDFDYFTTGFWDDFVKELEEGAELSDTTIVEQFTFCVKEFKAFLSFCESTDSICHLNCSTRGQPIVVRNVTGNSPPVPGFKATLILATLKEEVPNEPAAEISRNNSQSEANNQTSENPAEAIAKRRKIQSSVEG